jgi:alpha-tubulin suppressor-like RCC1 family protein
VSPSTRFLGLLLLAGLAAGCGDEDPIQVEETAGTYQSIGVGGTHTCAVTIDGELFCWGAGGNGQLGHGGTEGSDKPRVAPFDVPLKSVSSGLKHSCALSADGRAFCWGWAFYGQLGDGTEIPRLSPYPVAGASRYTQISAGWYHTCAVTTDQQIRCWGRGSQGQLGNAVLVEHSGPVAVSGTGTVPTRWQSVSAGAFHTCAIDSTNRAWCWGANEVGQLGNGGTLNSTVPVAVADTLHFMAITAGLSHTCALTVNGRAWCWGSSVYGELGTTVASGQAGQATATSPEPVFGGGTFSAIDAGKNVTCATREAHVECWGHGLNGQLGDPRLADTSVPRTILTLERATLRSVDVSPTDHVCSLSNYGGGYCWGRGPEGQLGLGQLVFTVTPTRVDPR